MFNLPQTSHDANKSASLEMRSRHWDRIKEALTILNLATGEQIALEAKMDYHAVMRRLSEMERLEMVYKPGGKIPTKTGRLAYQYALRNSDTVLPEPEHHYQKEDTTAADIACMILNKHENLKNKVLVQVDLFGNERGL